MKANELDEFVGKRVLITEYDKTEKSGILYKITNSRIVNWPNDCNLTPIKDGYFLAYIHHKFSRGICYRRSHIKKISLWRGNENLV